MIRRPLTRAGGAAVAACLCLLWGRSTLAGAPADAAPVAVAAAAEAPPAVIGAGEIQSIGVQFGTAAVASVRPATSLVRDAAATTPGTAASTTGEGIATIPLPPSAYPGMVGLATAAFSVWRYRRRRR
jgi:hypothetical protein